MHRINSSLEGSTLPRALILLCLVWTLAPAPLLSQGSAGEVRLEVKDPSGAGVEAGGTLENLATGADQTFTPTLRADIPSETWPLAVTGYKSRGRDSPRNTFP